MGTSQDVSNALFDRLLVREGRVRWQLGFVDQLEKYGSMITDRPVLYIPLANVR